MTLSARFAPLARFGILLPVMAWLLALAVSAWIAAKWYWRIAGPRVEYSQHAAQTEPLVAAREISSRHLFGIVVQPTAGGDGQQGIAGAGRFKLLGVAANSGATPGFAILQDGSNPAIAVVEGEEVQPGLKLTKVLPQAVELTRGGVRETLRLTDAPGGPALPISVITPVNTPQDVQPSITTPQTMPPGAPSSTLAAPGIVSPQPISAGGSPARMPGVRPPAEE